MLEVVGGVGYAHSLFPLLEILPTVEETAVREAASESCRSIVDQIADQHRKQLNEYAAMIARLAGKEWFTARISAAGLLAEAYPRLADEGQRKEHLELFRALCRDETPMVRRVAARFVGTMLQNVVRALGRDSLSQEGIVVTTFLPLYEEFASTEQPDSVRLQTTENCVAFGQVLTAMQQEDGSLRESELALLQRILPLIVATIDDRSWRVRWTAAAKFADVVRAYDRLPDTMDALVTAYEKLLQDPEAEVRTAATFNLAHVAQCNSAARVPPNGDVGGSGGKRVSVGERLVKRVTSLTEDDSEHVRAALAMVATELAPVLGKDATITYLVPPVLLLLRDAASEVRLNLISSLSALNEVIGVDLLSQSLLPAILDLAQDGKWRIRLAIIQHIPLLARQLGKEFFTEKLSSLCVGWLGDDIASIRQAAAANLRELTALFGTEWAIQHLLPSIVEIRENRSYLRRLTALQACAMMATVMDANAARVEILPLVMDMSADVVPNIRFNVAKELRAMAPVWGQAAYETQIGPILAMLMEDDDRDVRFYAEKASSELEEEFSAAAAAVAAK